MAYKISQSNASTDEPEQDNQTRHAQNQQPGPIAWAKSTIKNLFPNNKNIQPILTRPPERKQEEHSEDERDHFARVGIEPTRDKNGADERRAQVPRRKRQPGDPSGHAGNAPLVGCALK
jgi:hypothetical protein